MKITLTKEELRQQLRLLAGFEPVRADCAVEYIDGVSVDAFLDCKLRSWYLDLLSHADMSFLAPSDLSSGSRITEGPCGGSIVIPPAMCCRVSAVRLGGWKRPVAVLPETEVDLVVRRQSNPFLSAGAETPIAVLIPGGTSGAIGGILSWPASGKVELLTGVLDTGPDSFAFDETALTFLDNIVKQLNLT